MIEVRKMKGKVCPWAIFVDGVEVEAFAYRGAAVKRAKEMGAAK